MFYAYGGPPCPKLRSPASARTATTIEHRLAAQIVELIRNADVDAARVLALVAAMLNWPVSRR
jgi:hypothetical protein